MKTKDVERLVKTLRANGVSHFKDKDFEICFGELPTPKHSVSHTDTFHSSHTAATDRPLSKSVAAGPSKSKSTEVVKQRRDVKIPHKVETLNSLLKMNDAQLVDEIFPEGKGNPDPFEIPAPDLE